MGYNKTDQPGYLADETGHIVINTNEKDLLHYRKMIEQTLEVKALRDELDSLKAMIMMDRFMGNK